jgi:hypothetical protein
MAEQRPEQDEEGEVRRAGYEWGSPYRPDLKPAADRGRVPQTCTGKRRHCEHQRNPVSYQGGRQLVS